MNSPTRCFAPPSCSQAPFRLLLSEGGGTCLGDDVDFFGCLGERDRPTVARPFGGFATCEPERSGTFD